MDLDAQSIQLLTIDPHSYQFSITEKGKQFLLGLDRPISIITIAGLYRTGKSYLVNKLIKRRQNHSNPNGFKIGSTTESVTKGLNVWGQPILAQTETGEQMYYLLIDSEGLGSLEQEVQYDLKLLLLIFLISSTVVYNSVGAIDEGALDQLRVILNLKKCVGDIQQVKPRFIWVLRDFSLQLIDKNGFQMTPNQYLESCLQETNASNILTRKKNQIRTAIKQHLPRRQCITLVRPTLQQQDLAQLNMNKCKIRPQFLSQIQQLKDSLISGTSKDIKTIRGKQLDGKIFLKMMEQYIGKINSDQTPCVLNIWDAVVSLNNKERLEEVCDKMKSDVKNIQLPLSKEELQSKLNDIQNKAYNAFAVFLKMDKEAIRNHRQFIKYTQKINKDIKDTNSILLNRNVKNQMMRVVQQSIAFQKIKPTQLTPHKTIIQRLQIKAKTAPDCYDYIFQVVFDIFHISEQKSLQIQRQISELRKDLQARIAEKKQTDAALMILKHDYHTCLKQINELKNDQMDINKQKCLIVNQAQGYKNKIQMLEHEKERKRQQQIRNIQQIQVKSKNKIDQLNGSLKLMRQQKNELLGQLDELRKQLCQAKQMNQNDRKQFIFEQKMKDTWNKVQKQRTQYQIKNDDLKRQLSVLKQENLQLRKTLDKQKEMRQNQKLIYQVKQAEYQKQFHQLRQTMKNTKKSYQMTYQTMLNNEKVCKHIENITSKKKTTNEKENSQFLKNYYEKQLQKQKDYAQQIEQLREKQKKLEQKLKKETLKSMNFELQLKDLKQRNKKLENDIFEANKKFSECISQVEQAKQKQRSLYQESIVRLLNNIERGRQTGRQSNYSSKSSAYNKHF